MAKETIKNGYGTKVTLEPTRAEMKAVMDKARKGLKSKAPYKKVAVFLDRWVQKNFSKEGDIAQRGGWKSFSSSNLRLLKDPKAKLLQDKGRLRSSFIPFSSLFNAGIGSKLHYAKKHQEGEGALPPRPMLPEKKQVWPDIKKILNLHTRDVLKNSFKGMKKR